MAAHVTDNPPASATNTNSPDVNEVATALARVAVDAASEAPQVNASECAFNPPLPLRVYTRGQLLYLSKSPLVKPPSKMPELKDWFGEMEQNISKKDSEPVPPGNARERRFRRDAEDGETLTRANFRPTPSQPSQMGNFKHQSLRSSDRERDKEGEKDRERDMRDKEGQDRLRHLSDKYDRDRMALPSSGLRNKERETTPHLPAASNTRLTGQAQVTSASSRRAEARDAGKKKVGEASEDWRRGDPRSGREERPDGGRRERPRSRDFDRDRDPSRSRREQSTSRRERDRDDGRRDRDNDDDPRRWRDDGKREERMAARRAERNTELYRDRERLRGKETPWDTTGERRWVTGEERDGRSRRAGGREKKAGSSVDDAREREGRGDRDREKEPAWMDTYIPSPSSTGILGGKSSEGELDGIQAWKKEQKEKEQKEQGSVKTDNVDREVVENQASDDKQLDEIQLFRLLMKREEEKKKGDTSTAASRITTPPEKRDSHPSTPSTGPLAGSSPAFSHTLSSQVPLDSHPSSPPPQSLLSILGCKDGTTSVNSSAPSENVMPAPKFVNANSRESPTLFQHIDRPSLDSGPPPGSRLLAFARAPPTAPRSQTANASQAATQNGTFQKFGIPESHQRSPAPSNATHSTTGYPLFEEQRPFEGLRDANSTDPQHRGLTSRAPTLEHGVFQDVPPIIESSGFSAGKGSRFAKFFDGKTKDGAGQAAKPHATANMLSPSPGPASQRSDISNFNGTLGNTPDSRGLDEIYLMLNSSAQHPSRGESIHPTQAGPPSISSQHMHLLHQQQLHQQQLQQIHNNRIEPLYESRLDDRNFVPDGLVPGLRTAPPRNRDNDVYSDTTDDGMHLSPQRVIGQRGLEQLYPGIPSLYSQPVVRNGHISMQQPQFRGGPSPISHQQSLLSSSQPQRLPPGLANLGGRPPHDPSQFVGLNLPSHGHHGAHLNGSAQYNSFPSGTNTGFGAPQLRAPQQLQNTAGHPSLGRLNNMDPRGVNQNQFLGVGGGNGLRGTGSGFPGQQGPGGHLANSLLGMRQQQGQLQSHLVPHLVPHMQQQQQQQQQHGLSGPGSPAQDLMALLMGGSHRE